jgi:hypothetical protein
VLKHELSSNLLFLAESTAIDTYKYNIFEKSADNAFEISRILRINNYYSLSNKIRYSIIEAMANLPLKSITMLFKNAN